MRIILAALIIALSGTAANAQCSSGNCATMRRTVGTFVHLPRTASAYTAGQNEPIIVPGPPNMTEADIAARKAHQYSPEIQAIIAAQPWPTPQTPAAKPMPKVLPAAPADDGDTISVHGLAIVNPFAPNLTAVARRDK